MLHSFKLLSYNLQYKRRMQQELCIQNVDLIITIHQIMKKFYHIHAAETPVRKTTIIFNFRPPNVTI